MPPVPMLQILALLFLRRRRRAGMPQEPTASTIGKKLSACMRNWRSANGDKNLHSRMPLRGQVATRTRTDVFRLRSTYIRPAQPFWRNVVLMRRAVNRSRHRSETIEPLNRVFNWGSRTKAPGCSAANCAANLRVFSRMSAGIGLKAGRRPTLGGFWSITGASPVVLAASGASFER
jgi:hypothetical protein